MTQKYIFLVLGLVLFFFLPYTSSAYTTTAQKAVALDEHHALLLIEYVFGHETQVFAMPGVVQRDLAHNATQDTLGYSIIKNGREVDATSKTTAAILSSARHKDGMYETKKGIASRFILAVLLETEENAYEADYALSVTHLPFVATLQDGTKENRSLNRTELDYYITKEAELNTGNFRKK